MGISGSQKALMYALSGVMRAGASRSGYTSGRVSALIGGVQRGAGKTVASYAVQNLSVSDIVDATPNTCTFLAKGFTPSIGQDVILTLGSVNNLNRLFAGVITLIDQSYVDAPVSPQWQVHAIDYTWLLNQRKVIKRYTSQSASLIAIDLITNFAPAGFTTRNVVLGLDTIDEITFTNQDLSEALTNLAKRIGAYWYIDYFKDLHFFETDVSVTNPIDLTSTHASLSDFQVTRDLTQVVTRVFVEGTGSTVAADVGIGETILPVTSIAMFPSSGVAVSGPQRITYTGRTEVKPGSAPTPAGAAGAGLTTGDVQYAYTFVTGAGESLPSPLAIQRVGPVTTPTYTPVHSVDNASGYHGNYEIGDTVEYVFTYSESSVFLDVTNESAPSASTGSVTTVVSSFGAPYAKPHVVEVQYTTDPKVLQIDLWNKVNGGSYVFVRRIPNNFTTGTTTITDNGSAYLGPLPAARGNQVALSNILVGQSPVTARNIYRTVAGGSQLKLQSTLPNNTATTLTDATSDASLGANAPTTDTSGLTTTGFSTTSGTTSAAATTITLASASAFKSTGGWARISDMTIRYTGTTATQLTGIPSTGTGSIVASVPSASLVQGLVALTGIPASGAGSILYAMNNGDEAQLLVQVDDTTAQTTLAALVGGTGIQEDYIQDRRLSYTEAHARGVAQLALRSQMETSIAWKSRDHNTHSGRTITVTLGSPTNVTGTFKIQEVTIALFGEAISPTFTAKASTTRFSLEDLLRTVRKDVV